MYIIYCLFTFVHGYTSKRVFIVSSKYCRFSIFVEFKKTYQITSVFT